jgi:hypothetical protein
MGVSQPLDHVKNPPLTAATQLINRRAREGYPRKHGRSGGTKCKSNRKMAVK